MKAAVAAVNNAGGINGHRLELIICDDQGNPNVAAECASKMVSKHVIYVESDTDIADSLLPVLRAPGIPVMTPTGSGPTSFSFPNSYILGSGNVTTSGAAAMCAKLGSTKIGIAQYDRAGISTIVDPIYTTIAPFGLSRSDTSITLIPPSAVDLSSYAAALVLKSTCIVEVLPPKQLVPLAAAIHSQNPAIPIVAPGSATVEEWQKIGNLAANVCDTTPFPPANLTQAPGMARYNTEMDNYDKKALRDFHSVSGWASVHLAEKLLAKVANPSATQYTQALNSAGTIDLPPLPPLNFARPVNLMPGMVRLMSEDVVYFRHVNGGEIEPLYGGQYVDVMSLKSQPPIPSAPRC